MVIETGNTLLVLLLILFLGLIAPDLFKKLKMPYVTSLIVLGAVLGPHGLNYLQSNEIVEFFGFLGSAFLLLMVGLEVKLSTLKEAKNKIYYLAAINGSIPFLVGFTITKAFGYSWLSAVFIGIVFFSSSFALLAPVLKVAHLLKRSIGRTIVATVIIEDILSLFMLAIVLQTVAPITKFPLPIYFGILIFSIVVLKMFIPEIAEYFFKKVKKKKDIYETQLRVVLVILMAVVLYFLGLGVHPILAAFLVGMLLADVIKSDLLETKIHTLAYGLFVPVFFFIVGMETDFTIFAHFSIKNLVIPCLVFGLIGAKFFSGYFASRHINFKKKYALVFGVASTVQLTTTLAAVYAASALGLLDTALVTAIVTISVATTVLSPILLNLIIRRRSRKVV